MLRQRSWSPGFIDASWSLGPVWINNQKRLCFTAFPLLSAFNLHLNGDGYYAFNLRGAAQGQHFQLCKDEIHKLIEIWQVSWSVSFTWSWPGAASYYWPFQLFQSLFVIISETGSSGTHRRARPLFKHPITFSLHDNHDYMLLEYIANI